MLVCWLALVLLGLVFPAGVQAQGVVGDEIKDLGLGMYPHLDKGQVVWQKNDGEDTEIMLYKDGQVKKLLIIQ